MCACKIVDSKKKLKDTNQKKNETAERYNK